MITGFARSKLHRKAAREGQDASKRPKNNLASGSYAFSVCAFYPRTSFHVQIKSMTHQESLVECKTAKITFKCITVLWFTEKSIGFEVRPSFETTFFEMLISCYLGKII